EGNKLSPEHVRGTIVLLLIAGIDTTWSAIGAALWHLAQHPADRAMLAAASPELMGMAVEEFLRAYAPVTMARLVAKDYSFEGRGGGGRGRLVGGLRDEGRGRGAVPLPGRQSRSVDVRPGRRGGARSGREPPCRVRAGHPSVPRIEPGPHGAEGRRRGVDEAA